MWKENTRTYIILYKVTRQKHYLDKAKFCFEKAKEYQSKVLRLTKRKEIEFNKLGQTKTLKVVA